MIRAFCAVAALAMAPAGCSDDAPQSGTVQIMHWWNAGGEAQAIDALLTEFNRQYPGIKVVDTSVDGGSYEMRLALATRMNQSIPPDTFQANGGWDLMMWVLYDGDVGKSKMAPIDDVAAEWRGHVPQEVMGSISYGGHVYAVPLNIHRLNTLFYNKDVFNKAGIDVNDMQDLPALFRAADKVNQYNQGAGKTITPIALGYGEDGEWTLSLLFHENLLVGRDQGRMYKRLFEDPTNFDVFSPDFLLVLDDLRKLLSYTNRDAANIRWDQAMDKVLKGDAAMMIMGDWAKGYADQDLTYRDDVGFMPTPGTEGTFVFTTDTFGLPIDQNPNATKTLLRFFGSPDGQRIFNEKKGSISARVDVEPGQDDARRPTFEAFRDAEIKIAATSIQAQQVYVSAISAALANFENDLRTATATPSEIQHTIKNYRDVLLNSWK